MKNIMRVQNMVSERSGREVANQFILKGDNKVIFQSYSSIIAVIDYTKKGAERLTLGYNWDYSRTTMKYLHQFLREYTNMIYTTNDLRKAIKNKEIAFDESLC